VASLTPITIVASTSASDLAGADRITLRAPAVRWTVSCSREVNTPVHSSTTSTFLAFHGSFDGSFSAETDTTVPSMEMPPSTALTSRSRYPSENVPCTVSRRSRYASMSAPVRSLMWTNSNAGLPHPARSTLRPMRPNPLMAMRTAMTTS
jgi:hypothetical protein